MLRQGEVNMNSLKDLIIGFRDQLLPYRAKAADKN
jgi:hypothetical protein